MNYCNRCGIQLNESDSYCLRCGNKSRNDFTPDDRQARIELKSEPNSHCYPNSFCNNLMQFGTKRSVKQAVIFFFVYSVIGLIIVISTRFGLIMATAISSAELLDTLGRMLWWVYCSILYTLIHYKKKLTPRYVFLGIAISICAYIYAFMAMLLLSLVTTVEGSNSNANGRSARVYSTAESPPTTDSNTQKFVNLRTVLEWSAYVLFAIYIILLLLNPEMPGRKSSQVLGWIFLISIVFAIRLICVLITKVSRNNKKRKIFITFGMKK